MKYKKMNVRETTAARKHLTACGFCDSEWLGRMLAIRAHSKKRRTRKKYHFPLMVVAIRGMCEGK